MWSDNETTTDLLGFRVHSDLIRDVVTDESLLPVVIGAFGDWGGGKSSVMKMLEKDLSATDEHGEPRYPDVACLYFNGWMFEGYEDAKSALLSSILIQLGENERFGPKVRKRVAGLLKRVKWMEVAKVAVKHVAVPVAVGAMTGGVGAVPAAMASLAPGLFGFGGSEKGENDDKGDKKDEVNWSEMILEDPGKPDLLEVRKFRDDFAKMLADTKIRSLVILIDDLDRCLPERIIETLEAIKLFVLVPRTAFVIGADPRIVRHAIADRYAKQNMKVETEAPRPGGESEGAGDDLIQDYLEKLIQVPYHLPRLSPAEVETYINLLACQKCLDDKTCAAVISTWAEARSRNLYAPFQVGAIREAVGAGATIIEELEGMLAWSASIAQVVTEGLKGNPRQVKRMLNAMLLRKKLAAVAGIRIRDEVLAKLMVLEYAHLRRLQELNEWQAAEGGHPAKLKELEAWAIANDGEERAAEPKLPNWTTPALSNWLRMQPPLADVDLRDYFWLARDRTSSTLAGVQMVSPIVRRLFDQLVGGNKGERGTAAREAATLEEAEREVLLELADRQVERHPDQLSGPDALLALWEAKVPRAGDILLASIKKANIPRLEPGVANRVDMLRKSDDTLRADATEVLKFLATHDGTKVGRAAEKALKG